MAMMMTRCKPFRAGYEGGVRLFYGDDPALLATLEVYGSGKYSEAPWNSGPLVARRANGGRIVAWVVVRDSAERKGSIWEAWGVTTEANTPIDAWPWQWPKLRELKPDDHSSTPSPVLRSVATGIESPTYGNGLPRQPASLLQLATRLHEESIATGATRFEIPVNTTEELALLPWLWLIGPINWNEATLGPPTRLPTVVDPPLSYEGIRQQEPLAFSTNAFTSPFLRDVAGLFETHSIADAARRLEAYRQKPPQQRHEWLHLSLVEIDNRERRQQSTRTIPIAQQTWKAQSSQAPQPSASSKSPVQTNNEPNHHAGPPKRTWLTRAWDSLSDRPSVRSADDENQQLGPDTLLLQTGRRLERFGWVVIALLMANLGLLGFAVKSMIGLGKQLTEHSSRVANIENRTPRNTADASNGTGQPAPQVPVAPAATAQAPLVRPQDVCSSAFTDPGDQSQFMDAVVRRASSQGLRLSGRVRGLPQEVPWSPDAVQLVRGAALQVQLIAVGCVAPEATTVDGVIGQETAKSVEACTQLRSVLPSQGLPRMRWLCSWATSVGQSTRSPQ